MAKSESRRKKIRRGKKIRKVGRPPKLAAEDRRQLCDLALANHGMSIADLIVAFARVNGKSISPNTAYHYLALGGLRRDRRKRAAATPVGGADDQAPRRYGYTDDHRPEPPAGGYHTDLTDAEWELLKDLFDKPGPGRPARYSARSILNACVYVLRTGSAWRLLPHGFPRWENVYAHFRRWAAGGVFEDAYDRLRAAWREREHRAAEPTASAIDSQSVKTSCQGGPKGYDAGKKVKGRKRHLATDVLGLLLAVHVHAADIQDRDGATPLVDRLAQKHPTIRCLFADAAYAGEWARGVTARHGLKVEISRNLKDGSVPPWTSDAAPSQPAKAPAAPSSANVAKGFVPVKIRWVVERTNAWTDRFRRLSKDYDRRLDVSGAWIWLAHGRILSRRMIRPERPENLEA